MVMRSQGRVIVRALAGLGVGVHQRHAQVRHGMPELMLGADRDLVCLDHAGVGVDNHLALGLQLVADPPQPDLADAKHAVRGAQRLLRLIEHGRVDGDARSGPRPGGAPRGSPG
jgi:hypothetical protein